jgi:hypothetical protein
MSSSLASPSAGLDSSSVFLDSFSLSKATFVMSLDPPDSTLTPLGAAFGSVESLLAGRLVVRGISYSRAEKIYFQSMGLYDEASLSQMNKK